jgi:hypothetical protein
MKTTRTLLIVAGICEFIVIQLNSTFTQRGEGSHFIMILFLSLVVANIVLAVYYAKNTDRSPVGWGIGAGLVPYISNVILALLPIKKSVVMKNLEQTGPPAPASHETVNQTVTDGDDTTPPEELFTSFPATGSVFQMKNGWLKQPTDMNMENLRLLAVVVPSNVKWWVTGSSHSLNTYYLDLLPENAAHYLYDVFEKAIMGTQRDCAGFTFCLSEFGKQGMLLKLNEIRNYYPAMIAAIYRCRHQRKERLRQWLAENPEVMLKGSWGEQNFLSKTGYRSGRKLTSWSEVGFIKIESINFSTFMYILPKGSKGGMFSSFKAKHSLRINESKSALYVAECNFWRELAENESLEKALYEKVEELLLDEINENE